MQSLPRGQMAERKHCSYTLTLSQGRSFTHSFAALRQPFVFSSIASPRPANTEPTASGGSLPMPNVIAFTPPAETLTTDERLAELATILANAIARANPPETNEKSPLVGDSSLDILALRR